MKILKIFCWLLAVLFILSGVLPFFYGIFRIGSVILFAVGIAIAAFPHIISALSVHKVLKYGVITLYAMTFLAVAVVFTSMVHQAYFNRPPIDQKITAITLGAKVNGNQPSLVLRNRLRVTRDYLNDNPQAVAIMTGGQGADEDFPEGVVMAAYLEGLGISPQRIFIEDKSTNTLENLEFAIKLIPADSQGVVIISDDFHQKRATMLAEKVGIEDPYSLSSRSPIGLRPTYWARDIGGVFYTWAATLFS